jgi:hypothetical protein
MDSTLNSFPAARSIGGIVVVILGAVALYYLYKYIYGVQGLTSQSLITTAIPGNTKTKPALYSIPPIYEGGEYTVSFWVYVTGFKDQAGLNKHILEIRGIDFSTLAVGLGAHKNKLMVRVNTAGSTALSGRTSLSTTDVANLFKTTQVPSGLLEQDMELCDLPEVDLQRWVCFSIVLNGRTCDLYMDGKLARSCVLPGPYKVDPKGYQMKLLDFDGIDGFLSDVTCYQYALNPDQAYRIYMAGPSDTAATGFLGWLKSIFGLEGEVTYKLPSAAVKYETQTLTF